MKTVLTFEEFMNESVASLNEDAIQDLPDDFLQVALFAPTYQARTGIRQKMNRYKGQTPIAFHQRGCPAGNYFEVAAKDLEAFTLYARSQGYTPTYAKNKRIDGMQTDQNPDAMDSRRSFDPINNRWLNRRPKPLEGI